MKALVCHSYGSTDELKLETVDNPTPGKGQVLIDIKAAGLNFPDALTIQGKYQVKPDLPFVPGVECAGVVSELGEGVTNVKVGDRVISVVSIGAFAEKAVADARMLLPMTANMSFEQAAGFCITYATSYYAFKQRAQLKSGETVLVLGAAGGVGITAVQIAKQMGATVIAAASSEEKLDFACSAGADYRINYTTEDLRTRLKDICAEIGSKGVDVIYDPVGGELTEQAYRSIAWYGRHLIIGFAAGEIPKIPMNLPLLKAGDILGVFWGGWTARDPKASTQNFTELLTMVAEGKLTPITTEVFPLASYADAFRSLTERRAKGKVILKM